MSRSLIRDDETFESTEVELIGLDFADPGVVYTLRPVSRVVTQRLRKEHGTMKPDPRTRRMVLDVDEDAVEEAILHYALVGWVGIEIDGTPAPCDDEHRCLLPPIVQRAIVIRSQMGQRSAEETADSFREPEAVR